MNLREEILKESIGYNGNSFEDNLFFNKLAKGFVADYKVFGEDTADLYGSIFGKEYIDLFESFEENVSILTEGVTDNSILLFEKDNNFLKDYKDFVEKNRPAEAWVQGKSVTEKAKDALKGAGKSIDKNLDKAGDKVKDLAKDFSKDAKDLAGDVGGKVGDRIKELSTDVKQKAGEIASQVGSKADEVVKSAGEKIEELKPAAAAAATTAVAGAKGFLGKVWEAVKGFGKNLAEKFPGVAEFLQKGVSWIIANPLAVAGAVGGAALLTKIISVLKKKGDVKKAEKLQAALDKAKATA